MLTDELIALMQCPRCANDVMTMPMETPASDTVSGGELRCDGCHAVFDITNGVPDMVPPGLLDGPEWRTWKDHLVGFSNRREAREQQPDRFINRFGKGLVTQKSFLDFIDVQQGCLLDVGCGPGKFRSLVESDRLTYYGIDPMPLPGVETFPFLRGIGEHIPFRDSVFEDVVTLSALDHFNDLDAFDLEVVRVLKPGGRFHLMQSAHDVTGLSTAVKALVHDVKDFVEDLKSKPDDTDAPHHMEAFTHQALREGISRHFTIDREMAFDVNWYSPSRLFWTMHTRH